MSDLSWPRRDELTGRRVAAIALATLALMLWGQHGSAPILGWLDPRYVGPGSDPSVRPSLIPGVPWDDELVSFVFGALVCVALPAAAIKLWRRESLADYGLGLPPAGERRFAALAFCAIVVVFAVPFGLGARTPAMVDLYPLYRGPLPTGEFIAYECAYLLFFVALDGVLRGILLFGLSPPGGALPALGIAVETMVQATWHLGKPPTEAWTSPIWGLVAGYVAYRARSVWPVLSAHWLLNVLIDLVALRAR